MTAVFSLFAYENQCELITDNAHLTSAQAVHPMLVGFERYTQKPSDPVPPELFVRTEPTGAYVVIVGVDKCVSPLFLSIGQRLGVIEVRTTIGDVMVYPEETTVLDFA